MADVSVVDRARGMRDLVAAEAAESERLRTLSPAIVEWNRGCEGLYGYTREEALGQRKDELLKTTVPGSSFAELRDKLLEQGSWRGELTHRT